jgi:hypothetical protein
MVRTSLEPKTCIPTRESKWVSRSLSTLFLALLLSNCGAGGDRREVVVEIAPGPIYSLDGRRTDIGELKSDLLKRKPQGGELIVIVKASREATFEQVSAALRAAQEAGARMRIQGNVSDK